jgi:hypothetical protein
MAKVVDFGLNYCILKKNTKNTIFQEEAIKNPIPRPTRNGAHFLPAINHLPARMIEGLWFIGIITNWEEKSRKDKFRPDGAERVALPPPHPMILGGT